MVFQKNEFNLIIYENQITNWKKLKSKIKIKRTCIEIQTLKNYNYKNIIKNCKKITKKLIIFLPFRISFKFILFQNLIKNL